MKLEQVKEIIDEIKKRTTKTAYSLSIQKDYKPSIFDSKFGGVPYWDLQKTYPSDSQGNKLMLLAQFNFEQVESGSSLPQQGILQFFIATDDLFGLNFDDPTFQDTFRVVYHENIDTTLTREQILALNPPISTNLENDYTPIFKEAFVKITKKETFMGYEDYRFDSLFGQIASEKYHIDTKNKSFYSLTSDMDCEDFMKEMNHEKHWLLGYPYFTQADPRDADVAYEYYDTLLFQIDSDYIDHEDYVLWGDCGVANFFINHKDLENRDFSKILYNWDCC